MNELEREKIRNFSKCFENNVDFTKRMGFHDFCISAGNK